MYQSLHLVYEASSNTLQWETDQEEILKLLSPVVLEKAQPLQSSSSQTERNVLRYNKVRVVDPEITATVGFSLTDGLTGTVTDSWKTTFSSNFTVSRLVKIDSAPPNSGIRVGLELQPAFPEGNAFNDFEYYAPNACYNLNDLNEDGVDDYLDTQTLSYREDRLNALSILAYSPKRQLALTLSRTDIPKYDSWPDRADGQTSFFEDTDIGSLGFKPNGGELHDTLLTAAYPFYEYDRCNALLVRERLSWGAFRPVDAGSSFTISYTIRIYQAPSAHDALWSLIRQQFQVLQPSPVDLKRSLADISRARLEALQPYFMEDDNGAAGFVTNCHPQDGKQLGNVVQYGFTGMNIMNASNLLRTSPSGSQGYQNALKVVDFYTLSALQSPFGFVHGLYNMDLHRQDSWWTGLLLPLAYASPGDDLERLMGPLYAHRESIIKALSGTHGVYLRCVLEETASLLSLFDSLRSSNDSSFPPDEWLQVAQRFGQFLLASQELDGSWARAYDFQGKPLTTPDFWFGQTYYQQRSSTATVIPFLLQLSSHTSTSHNLSLKYRTAALHAGRFVRTHFVDKVRHNGGIHDSIYALPQLVDHESIHFCCRALLALYEETHSTYFLTGAIRAAQLSASWILLWDIPLPPNSTLATHDFRSRGCSGCDAPGAGYFHPMGVIAVPDLIRIAQLTRDTLYFDIAELTLKANHQNVGRKWGYALEGMQEEGVLLAPWFLDDDMFAENTGFGKRWKGEGNKTCLPWISAVTVAVAGKGGEIERWFGVSADELWKLREEIVELGQKRAAC